MLLATTGAMVLVVSRNFASFFLGLELLERSALQLDLLRANPERIYRSGDRALDSCCVIIIRSVIWSRADLCGIGVDGTLSNSQR